MNVDKKFLVAVFAAAAAVTFVISNRSKNSAQASLDAKKRRRKNSLKAAMKIQIQNMINTQKMIEAVLSAVRAYIQNKKVKTQKKELSKTPETLMVSLPSPSPLTVTPPLPPAIPASLPQQQFTYGTTTTITTPTQPQTSNRLKPWERNRQSSGTTNNFFYQIPSPPQTQTNTQNQQQQQQLQTQPQVLPQFSTYVAAHV